MLLQGMHAWYIHRYITHEMAWMSERRGKYRIHVCSRSRLLITRLLKIFSLHLLYSIYLTSSFPNYKLTTTLFLSFLSSFWSLHNTLHFHTYIFSPYINSQNFKLALHTANLTQVHIFLNTIKPSVFRLCANFLFQFHQIFYFNFFKKFLLWIWLVRYIFLRLFFYFLNSFLFISLWHIYFFIFCKFHFALFTRTLFQIHPYLHHFNFLN